MTRYNTGDVILVPFPFSDLATQKQRPALIVERINSDSLPSLFIMTMITSQLKGESIRGDYLIEEWEAAGLLQTSKVRLAKLATLEEGLLIKKLGTLSPIDKKGLKKRFSELFSSWV